jgi:hypothetical protein
VSKKKRVARCGYCGKRRLVTDDHVPPKGLFPKPRPSDLITVPICSSCNAGTSRDDEYFRTVIAPHFRAAQHPEAQLVLPSVWSSLTRPEAEGFRASFLNALHAVTMTSPMGLYIGKAYKYDIDYARIERVAERIARGLFFHQKDTPIPNACQIRAMCLTGRHLLPDPKSSLTLIGSGLQAAPTYVQGSGVFRYKVSFVEPTGPHPNSSAWLFSLYEAVEFIALVVDPP